MSFKTMRTRFNQALTGFKMSFTLSLFGTTLEAIVVLFLAYNIILIADLAHWLTDTILEGLFLIFLKHASRIHRRFPLGTVIMESILVTTAALIMVTIYGYVFLNYFLTYQLQEIHGMYHPALSALTILGGILTGAASYIQGKKYRELGLEIIKVDYVHASLDTIAAVLATIGVIMVSYTGNPGIEALFTVLLTFFVFHSLSEVFRDTFKTIIGKNIDPDLKIKVLDKLMKTFPDLYLKDIDARKVGSFYIVAIHIEVDPKTTIKEAYKIRSRIIENIREVSDLIYHVDVIISPSIPLKRKRR
ncbi:MAG: cation transporter [Desulfurococcaceae archaeon]